MTVRDREYFRESKRRQRARHKAADEAGQAMPTAEAVREALADAALILLAVKGEGSAQILRLVCAAFPTYPALALNLPARARAGRIKPRRLTPAVIRTLVEPQRDAS